MKKILIVIGILLLSFLAAIVSVKYERTYSGVTGNVCDVSTGNPRGLCYQNLPRGGFPFSYLFDNGGITGQGHFEMFDTIKVGWLVADIAFYFIGKYPIFRTLFLVSN